MPFYYGVVPTVATFLSTSATANAELTQISLRQATRNHDIMGFYCGGRANAATSISGIAWRAKRWGTVGSGGTAITPTPRRIGTTASCSCTSGETLITQGTSSLGIPVAFTCGAGGPGQWIARDPDAAINLEAGSADDICLVTISTATSLPVEASAEISE